MCREAAAGAVESAHEKEQYGGFATACTGDRPSRAIWSAAALALVSGAVGSTGDPVVTVTVAQSGADASAHSEG